MKTRLLLSTLFICLYALPSLALNTRPVSQYKKINLKQHKILRTINGKIDAASGVVRYLTDLQISDYRGSSEEIARAYLSDNSKRFGLDATRDELRTFAVKKSNGGTSVMFDQLHQGIPVYNSRTVITLNRQQVITFAASNLQRINTALSTKRNVTQQQALNSARRYLQVSGKALGVETAKLNFFESATAGYRLAWKVSMPVEQPLGDWRLFIDALDGSVLHAENRAMHVNGRGLVWNPDPLTTAGVTYGGAYVDNNDLDSNALNDERISVVLQDITFADGVYKLEGPYAVLSDMESPSDTFPELADSAGFNFTRNQQDFEAVMAYYHIDLSTRHLILDLGYDDPDQRNFKVDPHGLSGDDNSHYMSSSNYVAFGEGGVDDAEDADVLWHEHAHSFQTNLAGDMSYTGETMSLQEGSSDYWAASYSRATNDYNWGYVFSWDGHNEFWNGRRCDLDWVYPDDYVSGHDGGQIWSSALMDIWTQVGREVTDKDFIETHYIWGTSPGLQDAAAAYIQADQNVYGGIHKSIIIDAFDAHGLVNKADYMATITHTPLSDSEQSATGYPVVATIVAGADPLDPQRMWVVYGQAALTDSILMTPTGATDEYSATIPDLGNNLDIYYYITVIDQGDNVSSDPATAPTAYHSFHVGPDDVAPVITHTALANQALIGWPAKVSATVTDNFGVDTVVCFYGLNGFSSPDSFPLISAGNDIYENTFPIASSALSIGDSIYYYINATDVSQNQNQTREPQTGYNKFEIIDSRGTVLVIDDDPNGKTVADPLKGFHQRSKSAYGKSATDIKTWLDELGFTATSVNVATALTTDFTAYNLIISSSGANTAPVSDAQFRTKLENWVADPGHKLLIEGGEVGYDAISSPGYTSFAANVLHSSTWNTDNAGNLQIVSGQESHPLVTNPNALGNPLSLSYTGYGDQDAVTPDAQSYVVYEPLNSAGNAGLLVYDNDSDPNACQIIYMAFNLAAIPAADGKNLLDNAATYLLSDPTGVIMGNVDLSDLTDDSGASVFLSGDKADTTLTAVDGSYSFSALPAGTYNVLVHKSGYTTADSMQSGIAVNQDSVKNIDFILDPIVSALGTVNDKLPQRFDLHQNYPNPFNPTTTIAYDLARVAEVRLELFNARGQKIRTLVSGQQAAGYYHLQLNAESLASGIYFYRLQVFSQTNFTKMHKLLLLK